MTIEIKLFDPAKAFPLNESIIYVSKSMESLE